MTHPQQETESGRIASRTRNSLGVELIAFFKLFKGAVLFAVGVGSIRLLHKDVALEVLRWADAFRVDPNNFYLHRLLAKVAFLDAHKLKELSVGTFFYSGLLLAEGTGLLLGKRWGRYFTIIVTSSFIPLELFEIIRRISFPRMVILLVNIAIVAYLVLELRRKE